MEIQEVWVKQAVLGDDGAFERIYECIYRDMYKYAYYMLGDAHEAEDIVSEAVMDIYVGLHKLRDTKIFRNWAFKILSNKCKRRRKQYTKKDLSIDDENAGIRLTEPETDLEQKYDLEKAFEILNQEEKSIVLMAVFGGYKSEEIGEILNMKAATARSKLRRSLGKMREKLKIS